MTIHIIKLIEGYQQLKPLVAKIKNTTQDFEKIKNTTKDFAKVDTIFKEKIQNPDISIMVYGVYNAGKSTLINAMIGQEVAEVGDYPLTDKVNDYQCGAFKITDTPGIDAPREHEQTTHKHLDKADIVIFVVNPLGTGEEQKTLGTLMGLVEKRKRVFLVFNDKNQLSHEDYIKLKNQTYQKLQDLAESRGLKDTLKHIPVIKVNAKTALKAKIENKPKLLEHSGYFMFESELNQFIEETSQEDINQRLEIELIDFIAKLEESIRSESVNELVKKYDNLLLNISSEKIQVRKEVTSLIENYRSQLYQKVKSWLHNEDPEFNKKLEAWFQTNTDIVNVKFQDILERLSIEIKRDIENLETEINRISVERPIIDVELTPIDETSPNDASDTEVPQSTFDMNKLATLTNTLATQIKPEHIVTALQTLKGHLPTLMKGVGTKTMEKWAGQIVGKAIPLAGAVVSLGVLTKDLLSEDESTKALREHKEALDRARELRERQIEDYSDEISSYFANSLTLDTNQMLNKFFDHITNELKNISQRFNSQEQQNTKYLSELLRIKQNLYELS